jgi:hypothetical protein
VLAAGSVERLFLHHISPFKTVYQAKRVIPQTAICVAEESRGQLVPLSSIVPEDFKRVHSQSLASIGKFWAVETWYVLRSGAQ